MIHSFSLKYLHTVALWLIKFLIYRLNEWNIVFLCVYLRKKRQLSDGPKGNSKSKECSKHAHTGGTSYKANKNIQHLITRVSHLFVKFNWWHFYNVVHCVICFHQYLRINTFSTTVPPKFCNFWAILCNFSNITSHYRTLGENMLLILFLGNRPLISVNWFTLPRESVV